jgi:3-oxoacyl-[acyl-carrier protein] reductase
MTNKQLKAMMRDISPRYQQKADARAASAEHTKRRSWMPALVSGAAVCCAGLAAVIFLPKLHHDSLTANESALPEIPEPEILFLNAGTQNSADDIDVNLKGAIRTAEKYIRGNGALRSVLFNASASALSGQEFPVYAASKAGLLGYMKNLAIRLAPRRVTCNAICLGGVYTPLNDAVVNNPELWKRIMDVTPMKKWTDTEEVCDWVEFLTLKNRSMSGENILIDNGEYRLRAAFVWPEDTETARLAP